VGVQVKLEIPWEHLSASAVVIHYEEALYQVYTPLLTLTYVNLCNVWGRTTFRLSGRENVRGNARGNMSRGNVLHSGELARWEGNLGNKSLTTHFSQPVSQSYWKLAVLWRGW